MNAKLTEEELGQILALAESAGRYSKDPPMQTLVRRVKDICYDRSAEIKMKRTMKWIMKRTIK